jgi:hypothetical protein
MFVHCLLGIACCRARIRIGFILDKQIAVGKIGFSITEAFLPPQLPRML